MIRYDQIIPILSPQVPKLSNIFIILHPPPNQKKKKTSFCHPRLNAPEARRASPGAKPCLLGKTGWLITFKTFQVSRGFTSSFQDFMRIYILYMDFLLSSLDQHPVDLWNLPTLQVSPFQLKMAPAVLHFAGPAPPWGICRG